jgi:hypothetical protein
MRIRCRGNTCTEQLPRRGPGIVDVLTGRYQATHVPSRDRCIGTIMHTEILGFRTLSIVWIFLTTNEKTQRFGNWICFRPQVREDTYSVGSLRKS